MKLFGRKHGTYQGRHTSPKRRKGGSAKNLLSLCLVLILGVCLTVGGTLAFMQQKTETVTNTFKAGDITYTLNLEANAENVEMPSELTAQSSTSLSATFTPDKAPTKTGYTFGGWYYDTACTDANLHTAAPGTSITVEYGDEHDEDKAANKVEITLYAKWTPNTYEVAYNGNGATSGSMANSQHTYDVAKNLTANAYERSGYTFTGWKDSSGNSYEDSQSVINLTAENDAVVTLYAQWEANSYKIKYDANTGSGTMADTDAVYDADVTLRKNTFTKTGYTFTGWDTKDDGTGTDYADEATVKNLATSGDVTLYAQWKPITYTVKYNANGGTGTTEDSTHTYDVEKNLTENGFVRTGHDFLGWSTDENATTAIYTDKQAVINLTSTDGADVNLYAVWKSNIYKVSFDVNTNDNVDKPTDMDVIYGQIYGTLPTVTRDKYKFIGWTLTKDGDDYVTNDTIVNIPENHTLYAKWVGSHEYTITYLANASNASFAGDKQQVTDIKVQDAYYTIKTPTTLGVSRNGYVWTQWNTKPDGSGTSYLGEAIYSTNSDLTLYAIWATETEVTFGEQVFVNMADPSKTSGDDAYNFTIKCKTKSGADGIVTPIYNLIPGEAYRLTFSVTFNNFDFYRDDDGDYSNNQSTNGSYIFGTNIIDQYLNYDTQLSIISQDNVKTTSKYENMQWSTINSGHYEVYLDFVPTSSTMYWFWETTDIRDGQEMSYVFNNFNVQNFGPAGPRVEFEDLTVTFQTAPTHKNGTDAFSNNNTGSLYVWPNATNGTVRHKNYFHTESFGTDYLNYRVFGYAGHERMTIPISGLTVGQWYELSFTQNLSGATVYNSGSSGNSTQLYGCAVSAASTTADNYGGDGCVDTMSGYQDLRRVTVGNSCTASIKFQATASTMYWHWTLGDLQDYIWSDVSLTNVSLSTTDPVTLEEPAEEESKKIEFVYDGIDDTNMEIWYPVDEQYPVAGDSYELAFEPSEGFTMAEFITVVIDDVIYQVATSGQTVDGTIAPVYDPQTNVLTIPAECLTSETGTVAITASAVPVEHTIPTEPEKETEPAETEPTETEPAETVPAASEPTESAPTESAPVESKPTESEPAETETEHSVEDTEIEVALNLTNMTAQGDTVLQAGEDFSRILVPDDGYQLPEVIRVEIDDTLYEVYTDGLEHRTLAEGEEELPPMPTHDPAAGTLTIPAILLDETTQNVTITISAVEVVNTTETENSGKETETTTDGSEPTTASAGDAALPPKDQEEEEVPDDGGDNEAGDENKNGTAETTEGSSQEVAEK